MVFKEKILCFDEPSSKSRKTREAMSHTCVNDCSKVLLQYLTNPVVEGGGSIPNYAVIDMPPQVDKMMGIWICIIDNPI